jgi:hypothetical protein
MGTGGPIEEALQKPVPKAGLGFFVLERQRPIDCLILLLKGRASWKRGIR